MLMLRLTVEGAPMRMRYRWDRKLGRMADAGKALNPNPHSHTDEKEFERR
jgi:hypothetical protein